MVQLRSVHLVVYQSETTLRRPCRVGGLLSRHERALGPGVEINLWMHQSRTFATCLSSGRVVDTHSDEESQSLSSVDCLDLLGLVVVIEGALMAGALDSATRTGLLDRVGHLEVHAAYAAAEAGVVEPVLSRLRELTAA